ncbi:MAG TPA: hypothetical protein V6D08_02510 [Candidatus Obscuribacterales bacterium]
MDRVVMFFIGAVFIGGGLVFIKGAFDAKNLIESALFGLLGVATGIFLCVVAITGAPD